MAYRLGAKSRAELAGVHPDLLRVVERAIQITTQDFSVHDGLRTDAEQANYVAAGTSTTLDSKHLKQGDSFGHAVDLVPFINGKLRWEWPAIYPIAAAMHQAARELGVRLRWGGVWDRALSDLPGDPDGLEKAVNAYVARRKRAGAKRVFIDGPHFEVVR